MQAPTGHDVGLAAEDVGGLYLHLHEVEQAELAALVVDEEIDIGVIARVCPRGDHACLSGTPVDDVLAALRAVRRDEVAA